MLRNLRIEELRGGRQPEVVQVEQQLPRQAETFVDVKALVQIGIVDEALPADRRARLLEVRAHDDHEVTGEAVGEGLQPSAVLERGLGVVYRARACDEGQPRIASRDDVRDRLTRLEDEVRRLLGDRNLLEQDRRRDERPHLSDAQIVSTSKHGIIAASK